MKRPWQIWTLFLLCLAVGVPAMAWLTRQVLALDRAEALARRQAALEESVNLALWRMDTLLMPVLAQEAARPTYAYRPAVRSSLPGDTGQSPRLLPSPLVRPASEFVLLNFEVSADGEWISPQAPQGRARELAVQSGVDASLLSENQSRLRELHDAFTFEEILQHTPADMLPAFPVESLASNSPAWEEQLTSAPVVANSYDYADAPQQAQSAAPQAPPEARPAKGAAQSAKGANELYQRNRALQAYAQQQAIDQRRSVPRAEPAPEPVSEGVSRPFWMGDKLLLARRVQRGDEEFVQGCWLDWRRIEQRLLDEVSDLLPQAALAPLDGRDDAPPSRVLATLPVKLAIPPPVLDDGGGWSPMQMALAIAWGCLVVATLATAALLWGVIALSERRAAFVAAVTHELRTPLTTFRMYSEMLARGMAPAERRAEYLETLQTEADRLTHLVENVLAYARLERGRRGRRSPVVLSDLVDRWTPRLRDRAAQAGMDLIVERGELADAAVVSTDADAVGQILFNLVDNAAKYASRGEDRRIELSCWTEGRSAEIRVRDYGPGLSPSQRRSLFRPFSKTVEEAAITAPGVGLGLALCRRLARELGGRLRFAPPSDGRGACFVLELPVVASAPKEAVTA